MTLLIRLLAVSALVALAAALPAAAAPPSAPVVRVTYGMPAVSWTLVPGSTADTIQFTRSLPASPNTFRRNADEQSPLSGRQSSWRAGERFAPGTWYVHVASLTPAPPCPPDADECPDDATEWSPTTRFVIPPSPGIVAGKGVDFARLGMRTADVRSALGPPPSLDGTRSAPVYEYFGGALRVLFARGRVVRFEVYSARHKVDGTTVGVGSREQALQAAVRRVRCVTWRTPSPYPWKRTPHRYCYLGSRAKGAVMTYFGIDRGRVSNVKLGRVVFAKYDPFFGRIL
jgi:hypothetical protein